MSKKYEYTTDTLFRAVWHEDDSLGYHDVMYGEIGQHGYQFEVDRGMLDDLGMCYYIRPEFRKVLKAMLRAIGDEAITVDTKEHTISFKLIIARPADIDRVKRAYEVWKRWLLYLDGFKSEAEWAANTRERDARDRQLGKGDQPDDAKVTSIRNSLRADMAQPPEKPIVGQTVHVG